MLKRQFRAYRPGKIFRVDIRVVCFIFLDVLIVPKVDLVGTNVEAAHLTSYRHSVEFGRLLSQHKLELAFHLSKLV